MDKKQVMLLLQEYDSGSASYRTLARKYKVSIGFISKMVKRKRDRLYRVLATPVKQEKLPDDVKLLQEELRKLRLKVELQDIILDISSEELGVDLRKKHGARQS